MNHRLLTCFLLALAYLALPRLAVACQCSAESADAALRRAPLIIEGTVVRQRPSKTSESQFVVDLNAVRTLRGEPLGPTLTIKNGLECAPQVVEPGKRYVIYMGSKDYVVTACSRVVETTALAPEEVAAFGGVTPTPSADTKAPPPAAGEPNAAPPLLDVGTGTPTIHEPPTTGGCAGCAFEPDADAPPSALAALIAAALLGVRRRR